MHTQLHIISQNKAFLLHFARKIIQIITNKDVVYMHSPIPVDNVVLFPAARLTIRKCAKHTTTNEDCFIFADVIAHYVCLLHCSEVYTLIFPYANYKHTIGFIHTNTCMYTHQYINNKLYTFTLYITQLMLYIYTIAV